MLIAAPITAPAAVAHYLARAAQLEAASVLAFDLLANHLAAHGAPASLADDCRRAACEEVGHARALGALAVRRGASLGAVDAPSGPTPSLFELARANMVEGIVRETFGAAQAFVQAATAHDCDVRRVLRRIADEEASHAALSTRIAHWLDGRLTDEERAEVGVARDTAIAQLQRDVKQGMDRALERELGLPAPSVALAIVNELRARVWEAAA